jgi:trehalose 6-phosphate synthase/phosphatase
MVKQSKAPSTPTDHMLSLITALAADRRNTVFVVSGKERHSLTDTLGHIPNLGLAAEHGMFISWPTTNTTKRRWETMVPDRDRSWRAIAISIMEVYTSRTHGSYIEETEMKVLWQYRDADTEFGYLQARELEDHLANVLRKYAVDILHSGVREGGYVEVRPKGVNKGVLAMHVLQNYSNIAASNKVDFALVLGDDHCDEPMLSVMRQIGRRAVAARRAKRGEDPLPPVPATMTLVDVSSCDDYVARGDLEVFTCTVGKKPSAAATYLHDVNEAEELLESLVKVSARDRQFNSATDLRSMTPLESPNRSSSTSDSRDAFGSSIDTLSSGISKSMSLSQMKSPKKKTFGGMEMSDEIRVSSNLSEYMRMGTIEDDEDEDDDAVFF